MPLRHFSFYAKVPLDELCINNLSIDAVSLYRNAESYFTGDGTELIDGLFDMTCTTMEDSACYSYFLKISEGERLIWSVNNGEDVTEKYFLKEK
ncbi:Imm42 family immunity protein [Serratia sp. IR-2025]|uniref:Imm42 family immunity protein n=1 Tax=Serratia nevei TaxID=2703794 RepID=UPI0027D26629|nr:Imm42 family immunity protein [Serratia nevei]MBX9333089.1 hypothetical protein [Serratia marcescens]MDR8481643.1 Imm42 family immunity protein [Serratia nevei]WMC77283.1 Imm42 family immunity protein [Serratia nevei]WMC78814.1 Imm42 family immunity protein [Serratia nevei]